mgnify:CR=1 FL=1
MSKVCEICGKKPMTGCYHTHSDNHVKRRFLPNLQTVRAVVDGKTKRVKVCTQCIRSGKIQKPAN